MDLWFRVRRAIRSSCVLWIIFLGVQLSGAFYIFAANCPHCPTAETCEHQLFIPENAQKIEYAGIQFDIPKLGGDGFSLKVSARTLTEDERSSAIVRAIPLTWDLKNFQIPRRPLPIHRVIDRDNFSHIGVKRVLELPIKHPGTEYRVPNEFLQFKEVLQAIADAEPAVNPNVDQYYAYLTVDQGWVEEGMAQRESGIHVDGFQGARQNPKYPVDHSYIVSDVLPTIFYQQPFETIALDENRHNFFKEMDRQVSMLSAITSTPYQINLIDAYTLHSVQIAQKRVFRTFVRVTFSRAHFDRLGETDNPLFTKRARSRRPIPTHLEPFEPTADHFVGPGYVSEVKNVGYRTAHSIQNPEAYAEKQLGQELINTIRNNPNSRIFIALGDVPQAKEIINNFGWEFIEQSPKEEGFHRIYRAKHKSGAEGFVILRVNSPERLIHIHALAKIAGISGDQVYTAGRFRSWKQEFLRQLQRENVWELDEIVYGFPNSMLDVLLSGINNHLRENIRTLYELRRKPVLIDENELGNLWITEARLENGKRLWFVPNLYGRMAEDFFWAVREAKAKRLTYLSTAGSVDPSIEVGTVVTPGAVSRVDKNGLIQVALLPWVGLPDGSVKKGTYQMVPSFLVETSEWVRQAQSHGVSLVDVELGRALDVFEGSTTGLSVGLVVSDVLVGDRKRDITEWSYQDGISLLPAFRRILAPVTGANARVTNLRWFSLGTTERAKP